MNKRRFLWQNVHHFKARFFDELLPYIVVMSNYVPAFCVDVVIDIRPKFMDA